MKLYAILITLISLSCSAQDKVAFEFASYRNLDQTKSNTPIVEIDHYWKIYQNGELEFFDEDGTCTTIQIDSSIINKLKRVTAEGLEQFKNKTKPPANHFYAGYISFLKLNEETVCFNPYNVEEELKEALKKVKNVIEENSKNASESCSFPDYLTTSIEETHSKSNLKPNASPPPATIIITD